LRNIGIILVVFTNQNKSFRSDGVVLFHKIFIFTKKPLWQYVTLITTGKKRLFNRTKKKTTFFFSIKISSDIYSWRTFNDYYYSILLDEVNMYFPIGSFRSFSLPVEDPYEIIFIRTTRDRHKLVLLTPTIISIWLTKVNNQQ